ncbi:uncharacterized protein LOC18428679 isoform X2 [Amborella trichopoda]|nr:uncharacterized protein LOC18428679 isoform X2 [Amborella trichopoda]|eukprot:XP_020519523.1 uncharacterized protein LOC18428679 isoform X2 [Amborella trichopoda]
MDMASRIVSFIGLDQLSLDMASLLVRSGFLVQGYEVSKRIMEEFSMLGGVGFACPMEAGRGAAVIVVLMPSEEQINDVLFGTLGSLQVMPRDAGVILRSTVSATYIQELEKRITEAGSLFLVDVHVLQSVSEDSTGKIIVTASGKSNAIEKARPVLCAMSERLYVLEGRIGASSNMKLVIQMLEGIHLVSAVEAMCLGVRAGIHSRILYDILSNAAGCSWMFANRVPQMIEGNYVKDCSLNASVKDLGHILDLAKSLTFPLPLLAVTHQQFVYGSSCGYGEYSDASLVKIWERTIGVSVAASDDIYNPLQLAEQSVAESKPVKIIGFVGLGAMGFGMATQLVKSKFCVYGFDVYGPSLARFVDAGGLARNTPQDASKDAEVLIVMVTNEVQVESVLFGENGSISALPVGASIIVSSTVSPGFLKKLEARLCEERQDLKLVDAPVSGGVLRASNGTLTVMAAGTDEALKCTGSVLSAMSEKLYIIRGGVGAASSVKMANQLLAGVHIAAAAEAMAFGARLALSTRVLFEVIMSSEGNSWMFGNRVPHMLDNNYTPCSALDIFVKDLGIVLHESRTLNIPLNVSSAAHQQFLSGSAAGWGRYDDAAVVKVYEKFTGVSVEGRPPILKKDEVLRYLPTKWPDDPIEEIQNLKRQTSSKVLVVLDDDPTGTQTVHDITVLTEWSTASISEQFHRRPSCFFILTNSRSLASEKAALLTKEICKNIDISARSVGNIDYTIVLRGDSTLRGHFPEEVDAAASVIGEVDSWIICPFFLQGGRYTIGDIHYVSDGDRLVPAGETEFSKDAAFGYKASNLRVWIEEKTKGRIPANTVASISIDLLRREGPAAVCKFLCNLHKGSVCIVNAASDRDIAVFAAGMIQAETKGLRFLCRSAASFVSARIGIRPRAPIGPKDLGIQSERNGGLIVVGSYVPKTTKQVEELKTQCSHLLKCLEISVDKLAMKSSKDREDEINRVAELAEVCLKAKKDTLLVTSRDLITGNSPFESLDINFKVSSALVEIVRHIQTRPRYILAKGGITSSDIATKALEARLAVVVGQAMAGVPLWQLGSGCRHPGVPYIVFPGNVGDCNALAEVVKNWASPFQSFSTKEILLAAESAGYAVGAFNVYNLEGIEAVVAAAEAERSPAILQIHPSALKHGGPALVAACISAAEQANVPITVHFDHGNSKHELLEALEMGFHSIMVDGSHFAFEENVSFTKYISAIAHSKDMTVEAELGRLSGTEDDLTIEDYEAMLTDVAQSQDFIHKTGVDALAICIGNVHGKYPAGGPKLKLDLLKDLHAVTSMEGVFLVLHGASGLPSEVIKACIENGVRKFNVNTEVRNAYMESLRNPQKDLIHVMLSAKEAMKAVVAEKMRLFGSAGKA